MTDSLADKTQGRIVSAHIDVTLIPPKAKLGETDAAEDAGMLLIGGALELLKQAATRNGFDVRIDVVQHVF